MKQVLIASTFAAALFAGVMGTANAAEGSQPAQPAVQTQQAQQQTQVQVQTQSGAVSAQQGTITSPVYEVPGRENRAGSIYFGQ